MKPTGSSRLPIASNDETDAAASCRLGRDSLMAGDVSEALWHLRQAVENDADSFTAWQLLGRCFEEMGEEARAQRCYRLAFRLSLKPAKNADQADAIPLVRPPREPRDA